MRNQLQTMLLIVAVASSASVAISAAPASQAIPPVVAPSATALNTREAPLATEWDSIQSILWLYLSRNMTKVEVNALETESRAHPDAIGPRLRLIGYYTWRGQGESDRIRLRDHVLWMVENHPEHPATGEAALRDLLDDPEGNLQIFDLWASHISRRSADYNVLLNAEKFFFGKNPKQAESIIRQLHEKDPVSHEWPDELAALYMTWGVPGFAANSSGDMAAEAYWRVLNLTVNPDSREILSETMAEKYFKIGDLSGAAALAKITLQNSGSRAARYANTLLGRIALRFGDIAEAKHYLLESARRKTSGYMPFSAPPLVLAKELLERDQRDAVIEYLQECIVLWPEMEPELQRWIVDIENGKLPNFGNAT